MSRPLIKRNTRRIGAGAGNVGQLMNEINDSTEGLRQLRRCGVIIDQHGAHSSRLAGQSPLSTCLMMGAEGSQSAQRQTERQRGHCWKSRSGFSESSADCASAVRLSAHPLPLPLPLPHTPSDRRTDRAMKWVGGGDLFFFSSVHASITETHTILKTVKTHLAHIPHTHNRQPWTAAG